jgi:alkylated DNA repair dioxygenase AlkB
VAYSTWVKDIQLSLNKYMAARVGFNEYNVCFLNRYDDAHKQLGWHSDDSPGMLHEHPIAVVSFGEPRDIWWRPKDFKGVIPEEWRQRLGNGSVFVMPPGFQLTHQHRIPKGDREMGCRVSLTFRRYVP